MATKAINTVHLTETLSLSECQDGFWLYDKVVGMNLAMRAKDEREALTKALTYYQNRYTELKASDNKRREFMESIYESLLPEFGDDDSIEFMNTYR